MANRNTEFLLESPTETGTLARVLGPLLHAGDTLLLEGEIGAGKTFFARELISEILIEPEDIPSPTFTLVQTYETRVGEVWHADLYRLSHPDEIIELGLIDAFSHAICIVEWPDRLGTMLPETRLRLSFSEGPREDSRHLHASWHGERWDAVLKALKNA